MPLAMFLKTLAVDWFYRDSGGVEVFQAIEVDGHGGAVGATSE